MSLCQQYAGISDHLSHIILLLQKLYLTLGQQVVGLQDADVSPCGCISYLHPILQVDPAAFEISGHVIFKHAKDYNAASQDNIWRLLSYASYTEADVLDMARMALAL